MREIKYRAVIKAGRLKGKILPVVRIEWESYSNGEVKALNNIWCDPGEDKLDIPYLPKDVNLLEFTGLKDENGKDIYEGDIIKRHNGELGVVEFGNGIFDLNRVKFIDRLAKVHDLEYIEWPTELYEDCEIVGNIYENPELLEVSE